MSDPVIGKFFGCAKHPRLSDWDEELHVAVVEAKPADPEGDDMEGWPFCIPQAHDAGVMLTIRCMDDMVAAVYDFATWDKIVAHVAKQRAKLEAV